MVMEAMQNPLIVPILSILKSHTESISEHELLRLLEDRGDFQMTLADAPDLILFQKHFLIMNALYCLQEQLLDERLILHISPLSIRIDVISQQDANDLCLLNESEALKGYYSDLNNLEGTTEQDVNDLLNGFWERYLLIDKIGEALSQLGLASQATWEEVKIEYRRLATEHHPDRGGDSDRFIEVRAAYEMLSQSMAR